MATILKYQRMQTLLNEKQWRQYLATEAEERGNAAAVAREAGVSINTIARGRRDIEAGDLYRPGNRIRATLLHRSPAWSASGRVGWGRGEAPPPCRGTPLAVQSECRSAPSHPQAEAPGDQLGRV